MSRWSALGLALVLGGSACHTARPVSMAPLPRAAYAHYLTARMASAKGDWATAAEALAAAAAAAPAQPMIAVELARALAKAGRAPAARDTLAAARLGWPDHAEVWLASGEVLAEQDKPAALTAYRRAIALAPADERAYLGLAKLQSDADAERTLRALVAHVPGSVDGHYRLAVRLAPRDLPGAIAELRAVLERDPDQVDARLDLSRALRRSGKLAEAIANTRSAFDRTGQALDVAEELFYLLCEADDLSGATDLLALLDDDRSDADALVLVARFERGLGRLDAARAVTARITAQDADAGAIAAAELAVAAGDPAGGAAHALTVAAEAKRFAQARRVAGDAFLAAGDPTHALAALAPARAAVPADLGLAQVAAFAETDLGHAAEADAAFSGIAASRAVEVTIARARVADRAGKGAAALALLEGVLAAHPDEPDAANLAGYMLTETGTRLDVAERYLRHARELSPGDPAILDSWGWLLLKRGRTRDAIRALAQATRLAPREPEILLHLAAAWAADGAPRTALTLLDAAASLRPTPAVQHRLEAQRASLAAVLR